MRKNKGQWKRGQSGNPNGRPTTKAADAVPGAFAGAFSGDMSLTGVPPPTKQAGSDGVAAPGGFLFSSERRRELRNREKWVTFDDITLNTAIVAAAMRLWTDLAGSAKWRAEPNKRGGKDADKAVDIVTQGLFEAQTSRSWRNVVKRQMMKKFRGFALHEAIVQRRSDGMIVFGDLQHRPQWTVFRWLKPDEFTPWIGIQQLTRMGAMPKIPRERLLYSVEDTLTDSPDGVGLLRHVAELARVRQVYLNLEGIGVQTDLGGMPVGRAPLKKLRDQAKAEGKRSEADIQGYIQGAVQFLDDFLRHHNKTPDQSLMFDSSTYTAKDAAAAVSNVLEWSVDVIRSASNIAPVSTAIARLDREMARVMNAEWLLLGGADSGGAYSMHADKTAMFGLSINSALDDIADDARRDLATRLVKLNGLDPETCTPAIMHDPIATASVLEACRALAALATAGLHPKDEAFDVIRARLDLPPQPDIDAADWMLPRGVVVVPDSDPTLATPDGAGAPQLKPKPGATPPPGTKPAGAPTAAAPGQAGNVHAQTKRRRR